MDKTTNLGLKTKTKRGYLSNFVNYRDWFLSHDLTWQKKHMVVCQHCGKKFVPTAPNQKFCGPDNPSCHDARTDSKMANGMWVKNTPMLSLTTYAEKIRNK